MSRRATGFQYVSGRNAELKRLDAYPASSCRSLTSLISNSSDNSSITSSSRRQIDFDSNLHLQPLSQSVRHHEERGGVGGVGGGGLGRGGVEQVQMMPRGCAAAGGGGIGGGSGERKRQSSRRGSCGMPSMTWSSSGTFSVPQLVNNFAKAKRFPIIAKVTQGYYGDGRLKLPVGQVLQIYSSCEERRVRAVDGTGRQLTLPFSQVQSMDVRWNACGGAPSSARLPPGTTANNVGTNGCSAGCMKLGDVLLEATLPVTVSVLKTTMTTHEVDASRWNDLSICSFPLGTQLTVQSIYTCTHLLANVIENGWLDSSSIVTIPEDLRPLFRVALGLKDATPDEWKDFTGMFDRAARHIKFSGVKGYNGVIYEDWSEFSMTCDEEEAEKKEDSNPSPTTTTTSPPLVQIERYIINKKQLTQSSTSSSSTSSSSLSLSSPPDNNNVEHVRRFPKTSPYLGNRRMTTTVFGPHCSNSSSIFSTPSSATAASCFTSADSLPSLSSIDSAGVDRLSSRTVSGTSGTSGCQKPGLRKTLSQSSEPDYANIDDRDDLGEILLTTGLAAGGQHCDALPLGRGTSFIRQGKDIARVEDIALEDLSVGGQGVSKGGQPMTSDNRGTLISIDEGYSTKDSSRSSAASDAATLATSAKKRYSPVYF